MCALRCLFNVGRLPTTRVALRDPPARTSLSVTVPPFHFPCYATALNQSSQYNEMGKITHAEVVCRPCIWAAISSWWTLCRCFAAAHRGTFIASLGLLIVL